MRFNCCYGNIGWFDQLHGTSKVYGPYKLKQGKDPTPDVELDFCPTVCHARKVCHEGQWCCMFGNIPERTDLDQ